MVSILEHESSNSDSGLGHSDSLCYVHGTLNSHDSSHHPEVLMCDSESNVGGDLAICYLLRFEEKQQINVFTIHQSF